MWIAILAGAGKSDQLKYKVQILLGLQMGNGDMKTQFFHHQWRAIENYSVTES